MTVHKLTAGDGYTYLTSQVAAHDATNRGFDNLGEYYTENGEAPGVWMGSGLGAVPDFPAQGEVAEEQMVALFGQGRHPNAEAIEAAARATGKTPWEVDQASRLGNPYRIYNEANVFRRRSAGAYRDYNLATDSDGDAPCRRRNEPEFAPSWPSGCSSRTTGAHRPTRGNYRGTWRAFHGSQRPRSPDMTCPSAR